MCCCMIGISSVPRKSSVMFGKVRLAFRTILENVGKSSESGWNSSENRQKRRYWYVYVINRILHARLWI